MDATYWKNFLNHALENPVEVSLNQLADTINDASSEEMSQVYDVLINALSKLDSDSNVWRILKCLDVITSAISYNVDHGKAGPLQVVVK